MSLRRWNISLEMRRAQRRVISRCALDSGTQSFNNDALYSLSGEKKKEKTPPPPSHTHIKARILENGLNLVQE